MTASKTKTPLFFNALLSISFLFYFSLSSISVANSSSSSTQVDELLQRHIDASGGELTLMQLKSISRYGNINFYNQNNLKNNYCYHTDIVYPTKLLEQIKGGKIIHERGTDGISYWLWTGNQYEFTADIDLKNNMHDTADRANRDIMWVKKDSTNYHVIFSLPYWAPSNNQCIQQIQGKNTIKRIYCFDTVTGLLSALGSDEEYRLFSDWRAVENIKIPFCLTHYQNGKIIYEVQLDHVELNKSIPDIRFIKPTTPQLSCES